MFAIMIISRYAGIVTKVHRFEILTPSRPTDTHIMERMHPTHMLRATSPHAHHITHAMVK